MQCDISHLGSAQREFSRYTENTLNTQSAHCTRRMHIICGLCKGECKQTQNAQNLLNSFKFIKWREHDMAGT